LIKKLSCTLLIGAFLVGIVECSNSAQDEMIGSQMNHKEVSSNSSQNSYIDLIKWNGFSYVNTFQTISKEKIGHKIGEVNFRVEGSNKSKNYQLQDGDATLLDKGTEIFEIEGSKNFAIQKEGNWYIYEQHQFGE